MVQEDVLLPPLSGPREIAVYCREQGRWTGETGSFHRQGGFAGPQVRAKLLQRVEQRQVWDAVSQTASGPWRRRRPAATGTLRRNAGMGRLFEFLTVHARGSALIAEGQVVHAALL